MYVTRHVYLLSVVLATADRTFKANNTKKCTNAVLMVSIFWLKLGVTALDPVVNAFYI